MIEDDYSLAAALPPIYTGLEASTYDALWAGSAEYDDEEFFRWILPETEEGEPDNSDGPFLELGCGTGRLLLSLRQSGYRMVGVDSSPEMLALCRAKAAEMGVHGLSLIEQRMEELALDQSFAGVLIPGFSIQLSPDREVVREVLCRASQHLVPEGFIAITTFVPWEELETPTDGLWRLRRKGNLPDGRHVFCHEAVFIDRHNQSLTMWNRYETYSAGGVLEETQMREAAMAYYFPHEFREMLAAAGFTNVRAYGDFLPEPVADGHTTITYLAAKK